MVRTLREFFNSGRVISNLGALKFSTSVFRDQTRYPHWEMDKTLQLYELRPQVNSGINEFVSFIIGENVVATSEDEKSQSFLQTWLEQRPLLKREMRNIITTAVVTGNGYAEPTYNQTQNGTPVIDNLFSINDSSRIFINLDHGATLEDYWIYEVPIEIKVFPFGGQPFKPKFWRVNYVRGSILFQKMVYGIPVHRDKIRHLKFGWSRDGLYGRSFLASCIDDGEILLEILKNLAIISRSRALNLKLLTVGTEEDKATPDDIVRLEQQFKERREEEHIILNKPVKELNLSHQGQYDTMNETVEYLRKDIGSGLVPNFLTPWNSEVNRATAGEVKIPFQLRLDDFREEILKFFNEMIVESLKQAYPWLAKDLKLSFTPVDLTSTEEKMNYANQMFTNNAITLNEYRMAAGYDRVVGGDRWAYQLPSIPVDRIAQTIKEEPPRGDSTPPSETPLPTADAGAGTERLGPFRAESALAEQHHQRDVGFAELFGNRDIDSMEPDAVLTELFDTYKQVKEWLKKHNVGGKIKTLDQGDKQKVKQFLYTMMDKNLDQQKSGKEFRSMLRKKVQSYPGGEQQYPDGNLERIARTELARVRELRRLARYKEQGFKRVMHVTHIDEKTGKVDKRYNGRVFEIDYLLQNEKDRVPLHPNCRCTYVGHD
jgi:SPP1 gp7 family putative phage head morphogenesis protein